MSLAGSWEKHANAWIRWARTSPHDGFAEGTWPALRALLPGPGPGLVIDLGCGEGRGSRELRALGHLVVGADYSPTLTQAARASCPAIPVLRADAAALPSRQAGTGKAGPHPRRDPWPASGEAGPSRP